MKVELDTKLKSDYNFSGKEKLEKAKFYPFVKDRIYHILFSKNHKDFISYFLSSLFNMDYEYVYNNINISNSVLINNKTQEVIRTVDLLCEVDDKLWIIEMNGQANLFTLKRNKIYLYKVLSSYLKLDDKKEKNMNNKKELKKYECIYLININNFYPSKAEEDLDKEETVIKRKDRLVSYGKDYEIYDIYLPLIHKKWYTYSKSKEQLEKWEEFLLITLLDDSDELQKIIEKEDIYMAYRKKAKEVSNSNDLDFTWASIEADEYQKYLELEDAEEKGEARGLAEGVEQNKIETAKRLYKANTSMDTIKLATGFSEKQIRNICL